MNKLFLSQYSNFMISGFVLFLNFSLSAYADEALCSEKKNYLEINVKKSKMLLCSDRAVAKEFKISIGRGGVDKRAEGDGRTPVGTYDLGKSRQSNRFYIFIPIGYPTAEQRAKGFTGGDVGIHGPVRGLSWLGKLNSWFDWTEGCIAVGTHEEISEIVNWIDANSASTVVIH